MLQEFHDREGGTGHTPSNALAHQILCIEYYWPCLFKDTHEYAKAYHDCQTMAGRERFSSAPLQLVLESRPFAKWGLDFVGIINPSYFTRH